MSEICPVCGKEFEVLWPSLWNYKRNNKLICSWKCIRKYDRGERDMSGKTKEGSQMITCRQMVEAMEAGADPMEWLKEKGYTNPAHAYQNLRNVAKAKDPELFARFPVKKKTREPAEEPEPVKRGDTISAEEVYPPIRAEEQEKQDERDIWQTAAVRNKKMGTFYYDEKFRTIDWRHPYGEEISLPPEDWKWLGDHIGMILHVLGVDDG